MVEFNAADVLVPDGKLEPKWFNGKTPEQTVAFLSGVADDLIESGAVDILEGEDEKQHNAIEAWTYYSGYSWIADDLATRVGTITIANEVTKTTTREGPDYFRQRAADWLTIFYGITPSAKPVSQKARSHSISATFRP